MEASNFKHPRRFPKNVDGPFYTTGGQASHKYSPDASVVWCGDCLECDAPEEAPTLFARFDDTYTDTYFIRQPSTPEETEQAVRSARVCFGSAVRYGGTDRDVIAKLGNNLEFCDYIVTESGKLRCMVSADLRCTVSADFPLVQSTVYELLAMLQFCPN